MATETPLLELILDLYALRGAIMVVAVFSQDQDHSVVPAEPSPDWERLTGRELEVARLTGRALTNQQIAHRLGITTHTVNFHLRQIFKKLGIASRVSLAAYVKNTETGSGSGMGQQKS